jgi:hypothetical protein
MTETDLQPSAPARHIATLRKRSRTVLLLGAMAVCGLQSFASTAEPASDLAAPMVNAPLKLRGFGTFGIARSTSDQAEFVRDLSQPRGISNQWSGRIDSALGVQANWQATPALELVGQVVSRYQYDESRTPEVMSAFAKWEPDPRWALRVGRLGADFLMAADSRLVGYSYLPVRPSADFFGPLFFSYFDGADASVTLPLGGGLVRAKAYAGNTAEMNSTASLVWDSSQSALSGLVLDYFNGPWQLRASAARIRLSNDLPFGPLPGGLRAAGLALGKPSALAVADAIAVGGTTSQFTSVGAVYDDGPFQVQGMLNAIHHETSAFQNSTAGYLLAGYRLGAVTPFAGISWWQSRVKPLSTGLPNASADLIALNEGVDMVILNSGSKQTTYTLGMRWDVKPKVALKAQWDAVRGTARSLFPYRGEQPGWDGSTNVFSLALDFVF